jgi:hypothetical protein
MATKHRAPKGKWLKHAIKTGSETERARLAGRSLEAQAKVDEHSSDPKIRGKGVFALNARHHKFHPRTGPRRRTRSRA